MAADEEYFAQTKKLFSWCGFEMFKNTSHLIRNKILRTIHLTVLIATPTQMFIAAFLSDSLLSATESILTGIIIFNSATKFISMIVYENEVNQIFNDLKHLLKIQLNIPEKKMRITKSEKRIDWLQKMFLWNFSICVVAAVVNAAAENIRYPEHARLPMVMWFPFDTNTTATLTVGFAQQIFGCSAGIISFTFGYMTFVGFIIRISTQLSLLADDIKSMSYKTSEERQNIIVSFAREHEVVLRMVKSTNKIFGRALFLEIVLSSIQSCLVAFNCSKRQLYDPSQVFFIPSLLSTTVVPASICWCGELLITKSDDLFDAIYDSGWHTMEPSLRKDILIILTQSTRSLTLNAHNIFIMNLATFELTIQTAYSYLAVLSTIDN